MKKRTILIATVVMVSMAIPICAQTNGKKNDSGNTGKTKTTKAKKFDSSKVERGRNLFGSHCASCHADLGNSVKPGKPISGSQVLSTLATFKNYLDQPLGDMPHYEHVIKDEKVLSDLYTYVKRAESSNNEPATEVDKNKNQKKE